MKSALIIRPDGKCQKTVRTFVERGIQARGLPLIKIEAIEPVCHDIMVNLTSQNRPDIVVFTSTYAAKFVIKAMQGQDWPESVNIVSVGSSTAAMLMPVSDGVRIPKVATSEGLLSMDDLLDVDGKRVVIVKGIGGRALLAQRLDERGAKVTCFDCYERLLNVAAVEQLSQNKEQADCVVATSGELLDLALAYLDSTWRLKTWIVVSERVAQIAREKGIKDVVISPSASNEDLYMTCKRL